MHNYDDVSNCVFLQRYKEVPAVGLYRMTCSQTESGAKHTITLFPWKCAVWPGTLDAVLFDPEFSVKMYSGMNNSNHKLVKFV